MKKELNNPYPDNNCFFCGSKNKQGLNLKFYWDKENEEAYTEYLPAKHFVGQGDILHGAIQMGLLDEIMGWTSYITTQHMAVTSWLNVNFKKPVYICNEIIRVTCRVISNESPKITMHATISNNAGDECTTATGIFHILAQEKYQKLIYSK